MESLKAEWSYAMDMWCIDKFLAWMYVVVMEDSFLCSIRSVGRCRQSTIHQDLSLWTSSFANSADIAQP